MNDIIRKMTTLKLGSKLRSKEYPWASKLSKPLKSLQPGPAWRSGEALGLLLAGCRALSGLGGSREVRVAGGGPGNCGQQSVRAPGGSSVEDRQGESVQQL